MKKLTILSILFISLAFVVPAPALAQTDAGPTPGSFWYGITTTFENVNLFFTFSSERKAEKALSYAEKRLAQAKAAAEGENPKAVETALADYEVKINLASESSKKIEDKERAEKLLTSIADNTSKHQEVLFGVLEKVPEEAREAISKAIEVSRRGHEEATQQIAELKGEIEQLRQELAELRAQERTSSQSEEKVQLETEKARWEAERARLEAEAAKVKVEAARTQAVTQEKKSVETQKKTNTLTFPSGAIAEVDENGNILRWIKEAPSSNNAPVIQPSTQYVPPVSTPAPVPKSDLSMLQANLDSIGNNSSISYGSKKGRQEIAIQDWMRQNSSDFSISSYVTQFNALVTSYGFFYLAQ